MSYQFEHTPTEIRQINEEKVVVITWDTGEVFRYTMEYLRIACPCAECRGHTPAERKLIYGKRDVTITSITPVGHYAIKIIFSDDHSGGVFSWENLYELGSRQEELWAEYLEELKEAGKSRVVFNINVAPN